MIVGVRDLNDVTDLRLGRLPLHLVHHTRLPVLVVPPMGVDETA